MRRRVDQAVHAGLPSYTDGLRLLYRAIELLAIDHDDERLQATHAWLRRYADCTDWDAVLTSFRGDPTKPTVEALMGRLSEEYVVSLTEEAHVAPRITRREAVVMAGIVRKNFDSPDETRPFEEGKGRLDLLNTDRGPVGRAVFEPGWQWAKHVKPIAGTESCQAAHVGYVISGRMKVVMDDGESGEAGPGDFISVEPGHDAWVVGDEPCVVLGWAGFVDYAKPASS